MDAQNNLALKEVSAVWLLDGDWMKCRACKMPLVASRDGEPLRHKDGCKHHQRVHPWAELRAALADRSQAPSGG